MKTFIVIVAVIALGYVECGTYDASSQHMRESRKEIDETELDELLSQGAQDVPENVQKDIDYVKRLRQEIVEKYRDVKSPLFGQHHQQYPHSQEGSDYQHQDVGYYGDQHNQQPYQQGYQQERKPIDETELSEMLSHGAENVPENVQKDIDYVKQLRQEITEKYRDGKSSLFEQLRRQYLHSQEGSDYQHQNVGYYGDQHHQQPYQHGYQQQYHHQNQQFGLNSQHGAYQESMHHQHQPGNQQHLQTMYEQGVKQRVYHAGEELESGRFVVNQQRQRGFGQESSESSSDEHHNTVKH